MVAAANGRPHHSLAVTANVAIAAAAETHSHERTGGQDGPEVGAERHREQQARVQDREHQPVEHPVRARAENVEHPDDQTQEHGQEDHDVAVDHPSHDAIRGASSVLTEQTWPDRHLRISRYVPISI